MYTLVTTLIFTFVCFNAYVYGESHFVCKKMVEVFSSHKGDSGAIPSSQMRIGKQGIKGEKGEKPVVDYSTINATVESYIRKEISSVADNNVRMIEKKFENLTSQIEELISYNTEQSGQNAEYERRITEQAEKIAEQEEKIAEQAGKNAEQAGKITEQSVKNAEQAGKIAEQEEKIRRLHFIASKIDYDCKIRLVNGNSFKNGRIEVLHDGIWGTVCDDRWEGTTGKHNADVACRQLGFSRSTWFEVDGSISQQYSVGTGQIWLDSVRCTGSENMLSDCPHREWGVEDCGHQEDVAVECE